MRKAIIIQARMSSKRLPGKMLMEVEGKTLLQHLVDRLTFSGLGFPVIVATSEDPSDDLLEQYCKTNKIECFRGALDNVYKRFLDVVLHFGLDSFVRVTGDSPLLDPRIVKRAMHIFEAERCDLVTNVFPRSYPKGQSVEVFDALTFKECFTNLNSSAEEEHISTFFYNNSQRFKIMNFTSQEAFQDHQLSVDTADDLANFKSIVLKTQGADWSFEWRDFLNVTQDEL